MAGQYRRSWQRQGLWLAVIIIGLLFLGQILWATRELTPAFAHRLDQAQLGLALWRVSLFLLLIGGWPMWINQLARHRDWSTAQQAFVLTQRGRIAAWLIVIELVLVQRIPVRFAEAVVG